MIDKKLVEKIDSILPQTQCEECGYKGCAPYAKALAEGEAEINLCVPGGTETLISIGELLQKDASPFIEEMKDKTRAPSIAIINEDDCIGCTKCIQACPVDAIIGSNKKMHAILEIECTGCGLCVPPCPVDCIEMQDIEVARFDKDVARQRFNARNDRLHAKKTKESDSYQQNKDGSREARKIDKQSYILEALARVQKKSEGS